VLPELDVDIPPELGPEPPSDPPPPGELQPAAVMPMVKTDAAEQNAQRRSTCPMPNLVDTGMPPFLQSDRSRAETSPGTLRVDASQGVPSRVTVFIWSEQKRAALTIWSGGRRWSCNAS
jgi:hypothetical protein